jgi:uncharacterized protein
MQAPPIQSVRVRSRARARRARKVPPIATHRRIAIPRPRQSAPINRVNPSRFTHRHPLGKPHPCAKPRQFAHLPQRGNLPRLGKPRRLARLPQRGNLPRLGKPRRFVNQRRRLGNLRRFVNQRRRLGKQPQLSSAANRSKINQRDLRRRRRSSRSRLARLRIPRSTRSIQRNMSTISHDQKANRFTAEVDGHHAELDYTVADGVMTITHTRVPQAIGGRGIAAELMRDAVKVAGERGWSINPACSYAAAYMRKHAQSADKRHIDDLLDEALDESFPASDSPSVGGSS